MQFRLTDIRLTIVIALDLLAQAFKLSATDILKMGALRPRGGRFIEKYRDAMALPDFIPDAPR
jgi:hypothetical protein